MAARLAEEWFAICGGCEVTILDIGEPLIDVLKQVEIVHMPVLMDHKLYGQTGEGTEMEIPAADVGLISGGIRSEEHKKLAQEMRKKCKILISLGSCACFGGIPALANQFSHGRIAGEGLSRQRHNREKRHTSRADSRTHRPGVCGPRSGAGGCLSARMSNHAGDGGWSTDRSAGRQAACPRCRPRAFAMSVPPSAKRRRSPR